MLITLNIVHAVYCDPTLNVLCVSGTHGTGLGFGNIATMVTRLELVTGKGEILSLSESENPDIFKAAQVYIIVYIP